MSQDNLNVSTNEVEIDLPKKQNKKKAKKIILGILFTLLGIILAAIITVIVLISMGRGEAVDDNKTDLKISAPSFAEIDDGIITYKGQKYKYNQDMASILFMGVDKRSLDDGELVGEGGQSDALFLLAMNTATGKPTIFNISRDSMVDINIYDGNGRFVKTENRQICLSYAFGDGKEKSCDYTAISVSRMFYGIPINTYLSIDLDAITVLNDALGGVEVDVLDDLTVKDDELQPGKHVLLQGSQAEAYVRYRNMVDVDANSQRMQRQQQYVTNFIEKTLGKTKENIGFPLELYNQAEGYTSTNITPAKISYFAYMFLSNDFSSNNLLTVPGNVTMGEKYAEFNVDQEAFYQMILDTYYTKVD